MPSVQQKMFALPEKEDYFYTCSILLQFFLWRTSPQIPFCPGTSGLALLQSWLSHALRVSVGRPRAPSPEPRGRMLTPCVLPAALTHLLPSRKPFSPPCPCSSSTQQAAHPRAAGCQASPAGCGSGRMLGEVIWAKRLHRGKPGGAG